VRQAIFVDKQDVDSLLKGNPWQITVGAESIPVIFEGKVRGKREVKENDSNPQSPSSEKSFFRSPISSKVYQAMREGVLTSREIASKVGLNVKRVYGAMRYLSLSGHIKRDGRSGKWTVTNKEVVQNNPGRSTTVVRGGLTKKRGRKKGGYTCDICKKHFTSVQGLGGHVAGHKRKGEV
jgi:hypothetical protein